MLSRTASRDCPRDLPTRAQVSDPRARREDQDDEQRYSEDAATGELTNAATIDPTVPR